MVTQIFMLQILELMEAKIKNEAPEFDLLAGLATAGIPHAAALAVKMGLPMAYVRSTAKGHGRGRQVEGDHRPGDKLLFVEDLVNQASSLKACAEGAIREDAVPVGCLCIVDYQMENAKKVYL